MTGTDGETAIRQLDASGRPAAPPTVRVTDALWQRLSPLIGAYDPPAAVGRHAVDRRLVLDAILYRTATGCSWRQLPTSYGHTSSIYRAYRRWRDVGLLDRIIAEIVGGGRDQTGRRVPSDSHPRSESAVSARDWREVAAEDLRRALK